MPERLPFKEIAERVDIADVAHYFGVKIVKDRAACPACKSNDRGIEFYPETNSFCCFAAPPPPDKKHLGGDCITLYAHIKGYNGQYRAAKELQELFLAGSSATAPATAPPAPTPQKVEAKPERTFDPASYAAKLQYGPEVEALGLTEDEAKASYVGVYRDQLHIPGPRRADGVPRGWWKLVDGRLVAPVGGWVADTSNVVTLRRA